MVYKVGYKKRAPMRRRNYKKTRAKAKSKVPGVTSAVQRYVKYQVHKNIENKTVSDKNQIDFGSYLFDANLHVTPVYPCSATLVIPPGIGQGNRIGNTITTRKLLLKYTLFANKQDDAVNPQPIPQEVMIWIGYLKGARSISPQGTPNFDNLYQNGSSTTGPFSNLWDTMLPLNTDMFTICKVFRHKIGNAVYTDYAGIKPNNYYTNNDFKLNLARTVDLTSCINKVLKFNDASTDSDTGLFMWMESVNADGSESNTSSRPVGMQYVLRYDYEDA